GADVVLHLNGRRGLRGVPGAVDARHGDRVDAPRTGSRPLGSKLQVLSVHDDPVGSGVAVARAVHGLVARDLADLAGQTATVVAGRVAHGDVPHRVIGRPEIPGIRGGAQDRGQTGIVAGAGAVRGAGVVRRAGAAVVARCARRRYMHASARGIAGVGGAGVIVVAVERRAADARRGAAGWPDTVDRGSSIALIVRGALIVVVARRPRGRRRMEAAESRIAHVIGARIAVIAVGRRTAALAIAGVAGDVDGRAGVVVAARGAGARGVDAPARGTARIGRARIVVVAVRRRTSDTRAHRLAAVSEAAERDSCFAMIV